MAAVAPVVSDLVDFLNASPTAFHAVGTTPVCLSFFLLPSSFFPSTPLAD
jgi:hypothetical protein